MRPAERPSRLHRLLLDLHPRPFRDEYGEAIEETLARRFGEARERGPRAILRFWLVETIGLIGSVARERSGGWARRPRLPALTREVRLAVRRLARVPGFTGAVVLTLALAIGANTAIFTVVRRVVLAPLPYPESERLVALDHGALGLDRASGLGATSGLYWQYAERARTLESVALHQSVEMTLSGDGEAESVTVTRATPSLVRVLGVEPALGRWFAEREGAPGGTPTAVLSHALWTRRYGADPEVLGRTIVLAGMAAEVVGVMPPDFDYPTLYTGASTALWIPLQLGAGNVRAGGFNFAGVGRLAEGTTVENALTETAGLIARLPQDFPADESAAAMVADARIVPALRSLKDETLGSVGRTLWILAGAAATLLLVACANVANLFLARTEARQREVAVRRALGAGRRGVTAYFLSESLVLSALGGALGLAAAAGGVELLVAYGPADLPRLTEVRIDGPVLLFSAAVALLSALAFGALPLLKGASDPGSALQEIGRGQTAGRARARTRDVLMATQIALALVLLIGSGLMARSFQRLTALDPGFATEDGLLYRILLPSAYATSGESAAFHREMLGRVRALPGVRAASATTCPPLSGYCFGDPLRVEGRPTPTGEVDPVTSFRRVADGFFEAAGVAVIRGRVFGPEDHTTYTRAAVVDERLAQLYFPGEDPIGRRVHTGDGSEEPYEIVGVVGHVVAFDPASGERPPQLYLPLLSHTTANTPGIRAVGYVLRASGDPLSLVPDLRRVAADIDPSLALSRVTTLDELLADTRRGPAFTMALILIAGTAALALGLIGIYGVVSYTVSRRTSEIGVRVALGAAPGDVAVLIFRRGVLVTVLGLVAGLAAALAANRFLGALLYEVSPTDPWTYAAMAAGVLVVSLVACWIPASRAARMDPVAALLSD
jgi:predicted permease